MQDDRYPFAPPPLPGDTARPRRRRTRGHGKARTAPEQTAQAGSARPAARAAAPVQPPQQSAPPQREGGARRSRRRGGTAPAGAGKQTAPAAQAPQRSGSGKAAPAPRAPQPPQRTASAPQAAARRTAPPPVPARPEDPGLLLIARRPPKQKYANFEEYITAHGGVTAPLPEPEE